MRSQKVLLFFCKSNPSVSAPPPPNFLLHSSSYAKQASMTIAQSRSIFSIQLLFIPFLKLNVHRKKSSPCNLHSPHKPKFNYDHPSENSENNQFRLLLASLSPRRFSHPQTPPPRYKQQISSIGPFTQRNRILRTSSHKNPVPVNEQPLQ